MFLIAAALAAPLVDDGGLIAADLDAGTITQTDALFYRWQAHFDSDLLPERYVSQVHDGWSCGTGLVMELKENYDALSPDQQDRVNAVLVPWGGTLIEPFAPSDAPAPPAGTDSCFGQQADNRILTENFSVEWENGVSETKANEFADHMEEGLDSLVNDWGYTLVRQQNQYKVLVYISNDNGGGAYTTAANCTQGGGWMPYIVTYENVLDGDWSRSMAPHEYNHAQQYSYGFGHKFWYWEASATYAKELVHPGSNWWAQYVQGGYSAQPYIGMEASSQQDQSVFLHMYGMAIWNFYLDEHVGGADLVLDTWEYARTHGDQYDLDMDEVIEDHGYDFDEVYTGFMATNTVMEYDDQQWFGSIDLIETVSGFPSNGTERAPEKWGQDYIEIELGDADGKDIQLTFTASNEDWYVLLVGTMSTYVNDVVEVEWVDSVGTAVLTDTNKHSKAFLVVSPKRDGAPNYDWELSLVEPVEENPDDTGDVGRPGEGDTETGGPLGAGGGCGCAGGPMAPGAAFALMGLAMLRRREG
jgi:uncharacterized protein (TIGR03382 family)